MRRVLTIARVVWLDTLRRKDLYVLLVLLGALLVGLLMVDAFGLGGASGYAKELGLLMAWVLAWVLAVTISARELPREESRGTIYTLLARPLTRVELVAGKWLGAWSVTAAATFTFYVLVAAVVSARGGTFQYSAFLQGYLLHVAALAIVCALALLCSTRMNFDAATSVALALTAAAFLLLPRVPQLLVVAPLSQGTILLVLYYLLPHFEVFDLRQRMVHDWGPAPWGDALAVVLYGALMTAVFLLLAWLAYRHKRFPRGDRV